MANLSRGASDVERASEVIGILVRTASLSPARIATARRRSRGRFLVDCDSGPRGPRDRLRRDPAGRCGLPLLARSHVCDRDPPHSPVFDERLL